MLIRYLGFDELKRDLERLDETDPDFDFRYGTSGEFNNEMIELLEGVQVGDSSTIKRRVGQTGVAIALFELRHLGWESEINGYIVYKGLDNELL